MILQETQINYMPDKSHVIISLLYQCYFVADLDLDGAKTQ